MSLRYLIWLGMWMPTLLSAQEETLSDSAYISLLTVAPGEELYSVFGHSALRVKDEANQIDQCYNYGTFDFTEPNFYLNFCRGKLRYFLNVEKTRDFMRGNLHDRRSFREQRFNLDSIQKQRFFHLLEENAREENKFYQYDFFYDNCATRIRDMVQETFFHQLWFDSSKVKPGVTMRQLLDPYLVKSPWTNFGMDLVLGIPSDHKATTENIMFLPDHVHDVLSGTKLPGMTTPLVISDTKTPVDGFPDYSASSDSLVDRFLSNPLWVMVFVAIMGLLTMANPRTERIFDIFFWFALGVTGVIIAFLWFFTDHQSTKTNLNLFWALPTHLLFFWRNKRTEWTENYFTGAAILAALFLVFWKWIPQEIPVAAVPILILIVVKGLYRRFWTGA